jgi:WD40 repeat protein
MTMLWDTNTGDLVATLVPGEPVRQPAGVYPDELMAINSFAFSHDGRLLAAGANDAGVRVWPVPTPQLVQEVVPTRWLADATPSKHPTARTTLGAER